MVKILHFPFSPFLERISADYLQHQILSSNSSGKSSYFKPKVQLHLAAITQLKNG